MFLRDLSVGVLYAGFLGVISHFLGELLPRELINYRSFPFYEFGFEKGGRIYRRLGVPRWAAKAPDMSRIVPYMYKKKLVENESPEDLLRFIRETCVAEITHISLIFCGIAFIPHSKTSYGTVFMIIYALSNLPYILIQRYNRLILVRLYIRQCKRNETICKETEKNESFDTVVQHRWRA